MRYPYRNRCVIPVITAILLSIGSLSAPAVMAAETTPCLEEIEKYCNNIKPGEGILNCLRKHDKDLSTVCREKLEASNRNLIKDQQLCAKDIDTFCKGVVPGGGRILRCLSGHRDELAPDCREIVTARRKPAAEPSKPVDKTEVKPAEPPAKKPLN
jgi:Cysteine rich repeat